jgi:hypothetical protein
MTPPECGFKKQSTNLHDVGIASEPGSYPRPMNGIFVAITVMN